MVCHPWRSRRGTQPVYENGQTVYDVSPDEFAEEVAKLARAGVRLIGGCCRTTPEDIKGIAALRQSLLA